MFFPTPPELRSTSDCDLQFNMSEEGLHIDTHGASTAAENGHKSEVVTPAHAPRAIRVVTRSRAGSNASQDERSHLVSSITRPASRNGLGTAPDTGEKNSYQSELSRSTSQNHISETVSRYGASTVARSRNASAEAPPPPGSQRMKRIGTGTTGTFLKSGPLDDSKDQI